MIERFRDWLGITTEGRKDVSLNGGVIRAGHFIFGACRNHHGGDDSQIAALPG